MPVDLKGRVILITGASAGIGASTAEACATAGMGVMLCARRRAKLEAVAERCRLAAGGAGSVHWIEADVEDDDAMAAAFDAAWAAFGRLDAVFANAGVGLDRPVLEATVADHRAIFETNYLGTVRALRLAAAFFERTADGLGHFVINASCLSELGLPGNAVYAATKAAQKALADGLRAEVAGRGWAVTSVHPVTTRTEFFEVSASRSGAGGRDWQVPRTMMQDPARIARGVVRALRRRRPEVWGVGSVRWAMAMLNAMPAVRAWLLRRWWRRTGEPSEAGKGRRS